MSVVPFNPQDNITYLSNAYRGPLTASFGNGGFQGIDQFKMMMEAQAQRQAAQMGKKILVLSLVDVAQADRWHQFYTELYESQGTCSVFVRDISSVKQITSMLRNTSTVVPYSVDAIHCVHESHYDPELVDLFLAIWVPGKRASDVLFQLAS